MRASPVSLRVPVVMADRSAGKETGIPNAEHCTFLQKLTVNPPTLRGIRLRGRPPEEFFGRPLSTSARVEAAFEAMVRAFRLTSDTYSLAVALPHAPDHI